MKNLKTIFFASVLNIMMAQAMLASDKICTLVKENDIARLKAYIDANPEILSEPNDAKNILLNALITSLAHSVSLNMTKFILSLKVDPNTYFTRSYFLGTPVEYAAYPLHHLAHSTHTQNFSPFIKKQVRTQKAALLILYGANSSLKDSVGKTPTDINPDFMQDVLQVMETADFKYFYQFPNVREIKAIAALTDTEKLKNVPGPRH